MINQEMNLPVANRSNELDRMARPADIGQTIAAIIAITKSEWMAQSLAFGFSGLKPPRPKMDGSQQRAAPETAR